MTYLNFSYNTRVFFFFFFTLEKYCRAKGKKITEKCLTKIGSSPYWKVEKYK